ncbi:tripartite tricarboxylate transporter substrate binding protein [Acuticoccus sp.]|uniref:tripartite tricarboxylate transporter substrate binding protein n=1 Tax=Acuticoccus sp. TaxID=1904378 RepID=UPI003B52350E
MVRSIVSTVSAAFVAATMLAVAPAHADFPEKPITLIVPFAAGGSTETMARVFSEALGRELGQRVIVKTRPGAGGAIGATELSKAPADGYTIMFSTSPVLMWPPLTQDVSYTLDDFTPIAQITVYQQAIVARADAPFDTFEDLIAYAKDNSLNYADQGAITKAYIDYIASQEDISWTGIPTKGGGEAMPFLLGGKVDFTYSGGVHGRYGDKMKVLLALVDGRLMGDPDIPSIKDIYGIAMPSQGVVSGPAGLPEDVVAKLEAGIEVAVKDEEFVKLLTENLSFPVTFVGAAELDADLDETNEGLKKVVETVAR